MKCLVTGAAGFIGSHLTERLLDDAHEVVAIDRFSDFYDPAQKQSNVESLTNRPDFTLHRRDLASDGVSDLLHGVDIVFHLAAQAGVRDSWGATFDRYVQDNVIATQRLLEALKDRPIRKLVFASTSSVYGDAERLPTPEDALPRPVSPYGVTKLAAEHLVHLYHRNHAIPAIAVRYFTVYGPRQRPDMAFNRFIAALDNGEELAIYGDGAQTRDFTYVADAVEATLNAGLCPTVGESINVGGGTRIALRDAISILEELTGKQARITHTNPRHGDARNTSADITRARHLLAYEPQTDLRTGIAAQVRWQLGNSR